MRRKAFPWVRWLAVNGGLTLLFLALIEGLASLVLLADDIAEGRPEIAEAFSTQYDTLLGWVAIPGFDDPDFYGPRRGLTTDDRGFRVDGRSTELEATFGRILCSGDSFTLGYGVANADVWCSLLARRLGAEAVNMGQGGYGVDQAYLWYRRDGITVEHDLHLFAFIVADFRRAQRDDFLGFPKPMLELAQGQIRLQNVPVPQRGRVATLASDLVGPLSELRLLRLMTAARARLLPTSNTQPSVEAYSDVMRAVVNDLAEINRRKDSTLVLVFLPTESSHMHPGEMPWQAEIRAIAGSLDVRLMDLHEEMKALPAGAIPDLFITPDSAVYSLAAGHYTDLGNRWVAEVIAQRLSDSPAPDGK